MKFFFYHFLPPIIRKTTFIYFFRKLFYKIKYKKVDSRKIYNNWEKINLNRTALINLAVSKFQKNIVNSDVIYLEIGCNNNENFNCVSLPVSNKYGVDPVSGGNIRKTSDDFFEKNKLSFDVIFIDGLHTYQQCQKDIINSLKSLKLNGYIFVHDLIPTSWEVEHVPRLNGVWAGDVWKVAVELNESKGIEFKIINIDKGVGIIRKKSNEYEYTKLNSNLLHKTYSDFFDNYFKVMPILEHDEIHKII